MPLINAVNQHGEQVVRYEVPFFARTTTITEMELHTVREHRRVYATQVGELTALQKQLGANKDYLGAKELKEVIRYFMSCEKCSTIVIDYFTRNTDLRTNDFPQELHTLLDYEFNSLEFP